MDGVDIVVSNGVSTGIIFGRLAEEHFSVTWSINENGELLEEFCSIQRWLKWN